MNQIHYTVIIAAAQHLAAQGVTDPGAIVRRVMRQERHHRPDGAVVYVPQTEAYACRQYRSRTLAALQSE